MILKANNRDRKIAWELMINLLSIESNIKDLSTMTNEEDARYAIYHQIRSMIFDALRKGGAPTKNNVKGINKPMHFDKILLDVITVRMKNDADLVGIYNFLVSVSNDVSFTGELRIQDEGPSETDPGNSTLESD